MSAPTTAKESHWKQTIEEGGIPTQQKTAAKKRKKKIPVSHGKGNLVYNSCLLFHLHPLHVTFSTS